MFFRNLLSKFWLWVFWMIEDEDPVLRWVQPQGNNLNTLSYHTLAWGQPKCVLKGCKKLAWPSLEADTEETNQIFLAHCNLITLSSFDCQITTTPIATFPSQEQAQLRQLCFHGDIRTIIEKMRTPPHPPPHTGAQSCIDYAGGRDPLGVPVITERAVVQDPKTAV